MTSWVSKLGGSHLPQDDERARTAGRAPDDSQPDDSQPDGPAAPVEGLVVTGTDRQETSREEPDAAGQAPTADTPSGDPEDDQVVLVVREGQIVRDDDEEIVPADDAAVDTTGPDAAGPGPADAARPTDSEAAGPDVAESAATATSSPDDQGPQAADAWQEILAMFVDDPRASVSQADALVEGRIEAFVASLNRIAASVKAKQRTLQAGWPDADTEQLRLALHQYRELWQRLEGVSLGS